MPKKTNTAAASEPKAEKSRIEVSFDNHIANRRVSERAAKRIIRIMNGIDENQAAVALSLVLASIGLQAAKAFAQPAQEPAQEPEQQPEPA